MRKLIPLLALLACSNPVATVEEPVCLASNRPVPSASAEVVENSENNIAIVLHCDAGTTTGPWSARWRWREGSVLLDSIEWRAVPLDTIRLTRGSAERALVWDVRDDPSGVVSTSLLIIAAQ